MEQALLARVLAESIQVDRFTVVEAGRSAMIDAIGRATDQHQMRAKESGHADLRWPIHYSARLPLVNLEGRV